MMTGNNYAYLGVVQGARLIPFATQRRGGDALRATRIDRQAAEPPEAGEISLAIYEGSALLVRGIDDGEWIYSATVVEQAGQIVTLLAQAIFKQAGTNAPRDTNPEEV